MVGVKRSNSNTYELKTKRVVKIAKKLYLSAQEKLKGVSEFHQGTSLTAAKVPGRLLVDIPGIT